MANKRSSINNNVKLPRIDDLKLVHGIGPGIEKRLNDVGIFTFARLAALSPADVAAAVADLAGLSSERIIKQDWIGQARRLAAGKSSVHEAQEEGEAPAEPAVVTEQSQVAITLVEPQQAHKLMTEETSNESQENIEYSKVTEQIVSSKTPIDLSTSREDTPTSSVEQKNEVAPLQERYHSSMFTIEFLLDEHNSVSSTHVVHVQSKREHTWTGWQKTQLVDFLNESLGLSIPSNKPALLATEKSDHMPTFVPEERSHISLAAEPKLVGNLHVRKMEVIGAESGDIRRTLACNEAFDVRLTLDLTEFRLPSNTPLLYKVSIHGKDRVSQQGFLIGEAQGTIVSVDSITLSVKGFPLPEGLYRLAATIMVALPGTKLSIKHGTTAAIGDILQIY